MELQIKPARHISLDMRGEERVWRTSRVDLTSRYCCQAEAEFFEPIERFGRELLAPFRFIVRSIFSAIQSL